VGEHLYVEIPRLYEATKLFVVSDSDVWAIVLDEEPANDANEARGAESDVVATKLFKVRPREERLVLAAVLLSPVIGLR
jgi:hypothetical protein